MPTKIWAVGEELLAADMNTMVQQQVVSTFPTVAARDAASLPDGALCVTLDTGTLWRRAVTVWVPQAPPSYANPTAMKADTFSLLCAVNIGTNYRAVCSRATVTDPWVGSYDASVTRSTDGFGAINLTAADVQMTTILSGVANVAWAATPITTVPQLASARVSSNQLQIRVFAMSAASGASMSYLANSSVTVFYHVYGAF